MSEQSDAKPPHEGDAEQPAIGKTHQDYRLAFRALEQIGGRSWWVILTALAIGLLVGFGSDALLNLMRAAIKATFRTSDLHADIAILTVAGIALSGILVHLRELAEKHSGDMRPVIDTRPPNRAKVLILFVSTPNFPKPPSRCPVKADEPAPSPREKASKSPGEFLHSFDGKAIDDRDGFLEADGFATCNWRPACEALAYHACGAGAMLERVILIPSCDGWQPATSQGTREPDGRGSFRHADLMRTFLQDKLAAAESPATVAVLSEATLGVEAYRPRPDAGPVPLSGGIDFEDIDLTVAVLHDLYRALAKEGFTDRDVLVDVTGGQKTNGISGAVFAVLVRDRRFQYVSTNDPRKIRSYDVLYVDE